MGAHTSGASASSPVLARLAQLPPPLNPPGARSVIRAGLARSGIKIAVIDDDPTGTQVVSDLPLIASRTDEDIDWALSTPGPAFVVLTNSRSLNEDQAREVNYEVGQRLARRAGALGVPLRCISRSDSTLRGHFPAESDALIQGLADGGQRTDGVLLCPAFIQPGRVTIDDVHYFRSSEALTPVADTEFAHAGAFAYTSSNLREWAVARGVEPGAIRSLSLELIRTGGPEAVAAEIVADPTGVIITNAADDADLDVVVAGVTQAEEQGARLVYRTGPSFVRARLGYSIKPPLSVYDLAPSVGPGLLVLNSLTALTAAQLEAAQIEHNFEVVDLAVDQLGGSEDSVKNCAERVARALTRGDTALVARGHPPVNPADDGAARIADALVEVVRSVPDSQAIGWIMTTGGATTCDLALRAFGARRARVVGQIFAGLVSVWHLDVTSSRPGVPFVVFPDNVGSVTALAEALVKMKGW